MQPITEQEIDAFAESIRQLLAIREKCCQQAKSFTERLSLGRKGIEWQAIPKMSKLTEAVQALAVQEMAWDPKRPPFPN